MGLNGSDDGSKVSLMVGIDLSILLAGGVIIPTVSVSYNPGDISVDIFTTCDHLKGVANVFLLGGHDAGGGNCWQRTSCSCSSGSR